MIKDLKDLKALLVLCRKQGVREIKLTDVSFVLGDLPQDPSKLQHDPIDPLANFPQGELTADQLAFYSAGGNPEDDPENVQ